MGTKLFRISVWFVKFRDSRESLEDDKCNGRLSTSQNYRKDSWSA